MDCVILVASSFGSRRRTATKMGVIAEVPILSSMFDFLDDESCSVGAFLSSSKNCAKEDSQGESQRNSNTCSVTRSKS